MGRKRTDDRSFRLPPIPFDPVMNAKGPSSNDIRRERDGLLSMLRRTLILVSAIGVMLVGFFGFLRLRGIEVPPIVSDDAATTILRVTLCLYYSAWVFGGPFDAWMEASVLARAPNKGRIAAEAFAYIAILTLVFSVLCLVRSHQQFALVLLLFWIVNIMAWLFLNRSKLGPAFDASARDFTEEGDFFALARMVVGRRMISGQWQVVRFAIGLLLLCAMNLGFYFNLLSRVAGSIGIFSEPVFYSVLMLLFVIFAETWMWGARLKCSWERALLSDWELATRDEAATVLGRG